MWFATPAHKWFSTHDHVEYFTKYLHKDNLIFASLSPYMQEHFTKSFNNLRLNQPAASIDMQGLWRLFTANMWIESMSTV